MDWLATHWITILSVIANALLGSAVWFTKRAIDRRDRQHEEDQTVIREQRTELRKSIDNELVAWGVDAISAMAEAHIILATKGSNSSLEVLLERRDRVQSSISALVDRGRLYFPNHSADLDFAEWADRLPANKGYRDPILDALMIAHEELRHINLENGAAFSPASRNVFNARKAFISRLQEWLLPRRADLQQVDGAPVALADNKEVNWALVEPIVDEFETRYGKQSFWENRPRTRSTILAAINEARNNPAKTRIV